MELAWACECTGAFGGSGAEALVACSLWESVGRYTRRHFDEGGRN